MQFPDYKPIKGLLLVLTVAVRFYVNMYIYVILCTFYYKRLATIQIYVHARRFSNVYAYAQLNVQTSRTRNLIKKEKLSIKQRQTVRYVLY